MEGAQPPTPAHGFLGPLSPLTHLAKGLVMLGTAATEMESDPECDLRPPPPGDSFSRRLLVPGITCVERRELRLLPQLGKVTAEDRRSGLCWPSWVLQDNQTGDLRWPVLPRGLKGIRLPSSVPCEGMTEVPGRGGHPP